jgi:hypothetical protein
MCAERFYHNRYKYCLQNLFVLLFQIYHSIISSPIISLWINYKFSYVSELSSTFSDPLFQQGVK